MTTISYWDDNRPHDDDSGDRDGEDDDWDDDCPLTKSSVAYMLIPKWKQTLFRNGDSPYGNIRVSLPISVR